MGLHALILAESFEKRPQRKNHVLSYAHESFSQIVTLQNSLHKNAKSAEDIQKGNDIVNYLAEIYAHRFFRVISPADPALADKPSSADLSINDVINKIRIDVPTDRIDERSNYSDDLSNKDKLLLNLSSIDAKQKMLRPGIYQDIHEDKEIRFAYIRFAYNCNGIVDYYGLLEIIDDYWDVKNGARQLEIQNKIDRNPRHGFSC